MRSRPRSRGVPKSSATRSTPVSSSSDVAPTRRPIRAAAKSLSMTASTPTSSPPTRATGTPPPPQATTISPASSSRRISGDSTTSTGSGEATTRRQPRPASSATSQPRALASRRARPSEKKGPIGLVGRREGRVVAPHHHLGHHRRDGARPAGRDEGVADRLREQVAELALGHRAEHEQRLHRHLAGHRLLGHGERPDLGAVAVHHQQAAIGVEEADRRVGDVAGALLLAGEVAEAGGSEGVPADRQHDRLTHPLHLLIAMSRDAFVRSRRLRRAPGGE